MNFRWVEDGENLMSDILILVLRVIEDYVVVYFSS